MAAPAWPTSLAEQVLVRRWRVELGNGYSSPIVTPDHVFTVESRETDEIVRALDRATGKELWQVRWEGVMRVPFFAARNGSWVRCTPAYDGKSLFVGGMRDLLVSLDAVTGKENWRIDFTDRYQASLPAFGFVSSPLVIGDALYVQAGASFLKLDKATGKTLWRTLEDKGGVDSAFSSPVLASIGGCEQLLVQTRYDLAGVSPDDGSVFWRTTVPAFRGMNILNPVWLGDRLYTSSYGGGSFGWQVRRQGRDWSVEQTWKSPVQGYMATPVVIDGQAYLHRRDRRFSCVDIATGEVRWTTEERFGEYWSLTANGSTILALDQRGELLLIRASRAKFELLDRRTIAEAETWAHVAVVGDEVFVREQKAISAFQWRQPKS